MNEIKLKIGGKEYLFTLGLGFLGEVRELTGVEIDEIHLKVTDNPLKWLPLLMYCSYKYTMYLDGIDEDFSRRDMINSLDKEKDGINCKQSLSFLTAFGKSILSVAPDEQVESNDDEKKN